MRQNVNVDPSIREFEAFMDFAGGLNSEVSNEKLKDNEFPVLENVELLGRASAKRRSGRTRVRATASGIFQGAFFFYRPGLSPNIVEAIGGKLYVDGALVNITDGGAAFNFQATLPIEAVQYRGILYIATGTKLVQLTFLNPGWEAKTVVPYNPTVPEAIYIGTNALAANPDQYVQDGVDSTLRVTGIKPATQTAAVNVPLDMTAYIAKPAGMNVDYKWEYKKSTETAWTVGRDFTVAPAGKVWQFSGTSEGNWDIRVTARDTAVQTTTAQYVLSNYMVRPVEDKTISSINVTSIQTCRKIILHWDRILLSKDANNPHQIYVSDLENPAYFPTSNVLNFDTGKQESINVMLRFQDMLVVMTKTTIQTLVGKSPEDYKRFLIHDGIGCTADRSAVVVGNVVLFKSYEGIHSLKPNPYRLETMNVSRVDVQVKSQIPADEDACAMVYNSQYWLCFPQKKIIYRFYYELGIWTKDVSVSLDIAQFLRYGYDVYNFSVNGVTLKHNDSVYSDDGNTYTMVVETKFYNLSASFNQKRLRRLFMLAKHFDYNVELFLTVQADSAIVLNPTSGQAVVTAEDTVEWQETTEPNMEFLAGTQFGQWILGTSPFGDVDISVKQADVRGKCYRVKLRFEHKQDGPCELYGFGLQFKVKML